MYKKENRSWLKHLDFMACDLIMVQLAYIAAYIIRFGWRLPYFYDPYERMAIVMILIDIAVAFFFEPYSGILRRGNFKELSSSIVYSTLVFGGNLMYMFGTQQGEIYSRKMQFTYWAISVAFVFVGRLILKEIIRQRMKNEKNLSMMLLVSTEEHVDETLEEFEHLAYKDFQMAGIVVVDRNMVGKIIRGVPVVASADSFYSYLLANVVDEVFINGNTMEGSQALSNEILELGINVHINIIHLNDLGPNKVVEKYGNYMVLTSSMKITSPVQLFLKRMMDIVGAVVGLLICAVCFIIFAPIIKIQSPGPVFFKQVRVGRNGRLFNLYKFRSMSVDAEKMQEELMEKNEMEGHMFKMENDPRIFPIGKFMRKYSIDELPQFWNVLKGEMSLVGTRPPTAKEFEKYEIHHKARLSTKPGITGMWQVSGRSEIKDFEEVVALDTHYISQWSLGLDVKILAKTIEVVLSGKGSE
ncbi:MAG: sugar transferase [Lachnospiraceae bacterium]|nr:sugar transferase [Lachnospiraceae bacterium]